MIDELNKLYAQAMESLMVVREEAIMARKRAEMENRGTDARNYQQIVSKATRANAEIADAIAGLLRDAKAVLHVK